MPYGSDPPVTAGLSAGTSGYGRDPVQNGVSSGQLPAVQPPSADTGAGTLESLEGTAAKFPLPAFGALPAIGSLPMGARGAFNQAEMAPFSWLRQLFGAKPTSLEQASQQAAQSGTPTEQLAGTALGTVINPLNIGVGRAMETAMGASRMGRIGAGAVAGGVSGALTPGKEGETWQEMGQRELLDAGIGVAGGAALSGLFAGARPETKTLLESNIRLTPSEAVPGGSLGESLFHRFSHGTPRVSAAVRRQLEDYNRYLYNYAAEPLRGLVNVPEGAGNAVLTDLRSQIGSRINQATAKLNLSGADANAVMNSVAPLPMVPGTSPSTAVAAVRDWEKEITNRVALAGGNLTGKPLNDLFADIGSAARKAYQKAATTRSADDITTAQTLREFRKQLYGTLKGDPMMVQMLKNAHEGYARLSELASSAVRGPGGDLATPQLYKQTMVRRLKDPNAYAYMNDPRKQVTEAAIASGVGQHFGAPTGLDIALGAAGFKLGGWEGAATLPAVARAVLSTRLGQQIMGHAPTVAGPVGSAAAQTLNQANNSVPAFMRALMPNQEQ